MTRTTTKLEQKLIDKGYRLVFKTYVGKHSQKVKFYAYKGQLDNYKVIIYLDSTRTVIDQCAFENNSPSFIDKNEIENLEKFHNKLTEFVLSLKEE